MRPEVLSTYALWSSIKSTNDELREDNRKVVDTQDGTTRNWVRVWYIEHVVGLLEGSSAAQQRLVFVRKHWTGGSRHGAAVRWAAVGQATLERLLFGGDLRLTLLQEL